MYRRHSLEHERLFDICRSLVTNTDAQSYVHHAVRERKGSIHRQQRHAMLFFFSSLCPIHGWTLCTQNQIFVRHFAGKISMNLGRVLQPGDGLGVGLCGLRGWGWSRSGNGHVLIMIWGKTFLLGWFIPVHTDGYKTA